MKKQSADKIIELEKQGWELVEITHTTGVTQIHLADFRRPIP